MDTQARVILVFCLFLTPGFSLDDYSRNFQTNFFRPPPSPESIALQLRQLQEQVQQTLGQLEQKAGGVAENAQDKITAVLDHATHPQTRSGYETGQDPIIVVDVPNQSSISNGGNQFGQTPNTNPHTRQHYPGIQVGQVPYPSFPSQPWDVFRFYTEGFNEWWRGPNICIDRNEIDEPITNVSGLFFSYHTSQCIDTEVSHQCTTKVQSHGIKKTFIVTYHCCHGYRRSERNGKCEKAETKPMMDTLRSMGGGMFAELISYTGLSDKFNAENLTVFCPSDEALKSFKEDYSDNTIYVKPVKRRSVDNNDLVLSHALPGFMRTSDFIDEQVLYTENKEASIRTNVYQLPKTVTTVNCIPVSMSNQYTTKGVAHLIDGVIIPVSKTLGDIINSDRQFTILKTLLSQSGLDRQLQENGQFTLFAPTDDAFRQMDPIQLRKLLNGEGCVSSLLKYHILPNVVCSGVLPEKARSVTQLGSDVKLRRDDDKFYVNDQAIIQQDQMGTNGVMHVIDGILIPDEANTVTGVLDEWQLSDLLDLLDTANMANTVDSMKNITFFAPTNEAIQNAAPILNELRQSPGKLQDVLMYHVAQPSLSVCQIDNNQQVSSAHGSKNMRFNQYFSSMGFGLSHRTTIQCARILDIDRKACGASVHLVDRVLFPPEGHLVDILSSNQSFSIMRKLIKDSILENELFDHGPYTVLAPTDQAFHSLPEHQLNEILNDRDLADNIIRNHILPEVLCCAGIQQSHWLFQKGARTLAGNAIPMNRHYDALLIGSAHVISCDIMADNGVVHGVDKVLLPPKKHHHHHQPHHYQPYSHAYL